MPQPIETTTSRRAILLTASLVSSLVMLDSNIVAVALPTIAQSFNAGFAAMQWVITAYVLPFAALLLAAGSFGDQAGRRRAALIGQLIFAGASLLCGLALSPLMLNLARAAQGAGAALLLTAALAIINHSFRGAERAKAYAFWGSCLGLAITCGPIIGGVISSLIGWRWAFLINLPICAGLIVATLRFVPESRDPDAQGLDYAGVITFSSGLFLLIWAVIDGNALGWFAPAVLARLGGGAGLIAAFVGIERRQPRPMMNLALFRSSDFVGSACAMLGYAAGAQVMIFYLQLYLQNAYGYAPVIAGIAMLPFALPMFLVPRLGAMLARTWPSRAILCLGLGATVLSNIALAMLALAGASYLSFTVAMIGAGAGAGLLNGETAKAMQTAVPPQRAGMASGIGGTTRFVGLLFGVAGLGAVLLAVTSARFATLAAGLGLDAANAMVLVKRFTAGDVEGALSSLPAATRHDAAVALHRAFDGGFAAAALTAAAVALVLLLLTRWRMTASDHGPAAAAVDRPVAPGE